MSRYAEKRAFQHTLLLLRGSKSGYRPSGLIPGLLGVVQIGCLHAAPANVSTSIMAVCATVIIIHATLTHPCAR